MVVTLADNTTTTVNVENGKGISSIAKTSTAGLVDTYTITYNDSTTSTFSVTNGAKGDTGDSWYVWIRYAGSMPKSDADMGTTPDDWIGIYSGTEDDPSNLHYTDFDWFEYKGEKGDTGDAATITTQNVSYQTSSSGTVAPSGSWTTTIPTVTPGDFLWTRTQLLFNDNTTVTAYSVSRYGIDGAGSVSTVNGVSPDSNGNVALTATDIPASDNASIQTHISDVESDVSDLQTSIGIVEDTDTATHTIAKGQYVIWKDALYTASQAIPLGTALSASNLTAVSNGGFNALNKIFFASFPGDYTSLAAFVNSLFTSIGDYGYVQFSVGGTLPTDFPSSANTYGSGFVSVTGYYHNAYYYPDDHKLYIGRKTYTQTSWTWYRVQLSAV